MSHREKKSDDDSKSQAGALPYVFGFDLKPPIEECGDHDLDSHNESVPRTFEPELDAKSGTSSSKNYNMLNYMPPADTKSSNNTTNELHNDFMYYEPLNFTFGFDIYTMTTLDPEDTILLGTNFSKLMRMRINKVTFPRIKTEIDREMDLNPSINLISTFKKAVSKRNPFIMELVFPHCGFSKPSDIYIPDEFVIDSQDSSKRCVNLMIQWQFTINPKNYYDEDFIYGAVKNGHLPIVVELLNVGIDVNMIHPFTGLNLLTIACMKEQYEILELLLQYDANINVKMSSRFIKFRPKKKNNNASIDHDERSIVGFFSSTPSTTTSTKTNQKVIDVTCLQVAVFYFDVIAINLFLKYAKIDYAQLFNLTVVSVKNSCEMVVRLFLDNGIQATDVNSSGQSLLHFCLLGDIHDQDCNYDIAKLLIERGADVHLLLPYNKLLYRAIERRLFRMIELFLDHDADVQYTSGDGYTVIHKAIKEYCCARLIKKLLQRHPRVNTALYNGVSPLMEACCCDISCEQWEIVETLLHYGADVNHTDHMLMTPLHHACGKNNLRVIKALIKNGADIHAVNNNNQTPLHIACNLSVNMSSAIVQILVKNGAKIDAVDSNGSTPLSLACNGNNLDVLKYLLEHGANPNHINNKKLTPIHIIIKAASQIVTAYNKVYELLDVLLKYGADINIVDAENRTPLYHTIEMMIYYERRDSRDLFRNNYRIILKKLLSYCIKLKAIGLEVKPSFKAFSPDEVIFVDDMKFLANNVLQLDLTRELNDDQDHRRRSSLSFRPRKTRKTDQHTSTHDIRTLEARCRLEVARMKSEKVGIDDFTFYDLFEGSLYFSKKYFTDYVAQYRMKMGAHDRMFPLYSDLIKKQLHEAKIRYDQFMMRATARDYFRTKINENLFDECIDKILGYLCIEEIQTFIATMELSNSKMYHLD